MLGAEEAPRTDRAITATIGTGWEVRLAARHRGFAANPRMMNPFARFDFVAGRRASGGAARKGGKDLVLVCVHAGQQDVIQSSLWPEPKRFAIGADRHDATGQLG